MSNVSYPSDARLSDSLEREVMREAMSQNEAVSLSELVKGALAAIGHGISAVFNYVVDVTEALNEARANSARANRGFW